MIEKEGEDTKKEIYIVKQNVLRFWRNRGYWVNQSSLIALNKAVEKLMEQAIQRKEKDKRTRKRIQPFHI